MSHSPPRHRQTPDNVLHQLCQSCFYHMVSHQAQCCLFWRQTVAFVQISSILLCSTGNIAPTVFHCFNPQYITGPASTPICNPCSRTPYYLTHPIWPSYAGTRPIPYHEYFHFPSSAPHPPFSMKKHPLPSLVPSHMLGVLPPGISKGVTYTITNSLIIPEGALQLTLPDPTIPLLIFCLKVLSGLISFFSYTILIPFTSLIDGINSNFYMFDVISWLHIVHPFTSDKLPSQ